jgi:hypothetical protein
MRPRRWLAWKAFEGANWILRMSVRWLSWEQGQDELP